ncbi:hypothetical protein HK101_003752 [Irineochytrium annulatum]|nr:hypothetical protein HK101_003752 [Irineochytrium annulatum]
MPWNPVPRVTLNFVGFPGAPNSHGHEAPSRKVMAELPDPMSKSSRILTVHDLVILAKRDYLHDDAGIDPSRATVYTSEFAAIPRHSSVGLLRDGESLVVAFFGGPLDKHKDKGDKHKEKRYDDKEVRGDRDRERESHGGHRSDRDRDGDRDRDHDRHGRGGDRDRDRDDRDGRDHRERDGGRGDRDRDGRGDRDRDDRVDRKDKERGRDHDDVRGRDKDDRHGEKDRHSSSHGHSHHSHHRHSTSGRDGSRSPDKDHRSSDRYGDDSHHGHGHGSSSPKKDKHSADDSYTALDDDRSPRSRGVSSGHGHGHDRDRNIDWSSSEDVRSGGSPLKDSKKYDYVYASDEFLNNTGSKSKDSGHHRSSSSQARHGSADDYEYKAPASGREREKSLVDTRGDRERGDRRERSRSRERTSRRAENDDDDYRRGGSSSFKEMGYPDYLKSKGSSESPRAKSSHSREASVSRHDRSGDGKRL